MSSMTCLTDAGIWALDHRTAQNQVDSAALAGALELPDTTNVSAAADEWFSKNGMVDLPLMMETVATPGS